MLKICGFFAALAVVATVGVAPSVAATVTPAPVSRLEILDVTGQWLDTTRGTDVRGLGTADVRWGRPANDAGVKSGYRFRGVQDSTPHRPGSNFRLGTFTHFNRIIGTGTSITAARLKVSFSVRIVNATNEVSRVVRAFSTFDFRHLETRNQDRTCADGGRNRRGVNRNGCADRVTLVLNPDFSKTFRLGGAVYTLDITGFNMNSPFWTTEDAANRRSLFGRFRTTPDLVEGGGGGDPDPTPPPAPIPLPAAGWMLIAGLGGLFGFGRLGRRRA